MEINKVAFSLASLKSQKFNTGAFSSENNYERMNMSENRHEHMNAKNSRVSSVSQMNHSDPVRRKEMIAFEFERIFALQLVSQMTSGLFESSSEGPLSSPSVLYKSTINDTLASQLAREELFGFSSKLEKLWKEYPSTREDL